MMWIGECFKGIAEIIYFLIAKRIIQKPGDAVFMNLIYIPTITLIMICFSNANKKDKKGEARLKSVDCERHAVYGDPLFVSPETGVFTLLPESPAIGKGQIQMNISENGGRTVDLGALSYGGLL